MESSDSRSGRRSVQSFISGIFCTAKRPTDNRDKTRSTSATDTPAIPEHGQSLISYTVTAYANAESYVGESANSNSCIVGNPYSRMFEESFAEAATTTSVWTSGPDPESRSAWNPTRASYSSPECRTQHTTMTEDFCVSLRQNIIPATNITPLS